MVRRMRIVAALAVAVVITACATAPTRERIATEREELFTNGVPCASNAQCTSGFCVDAVCCNTACGGGARDLQSCSNVYGKIAGLTDGTCAALKAGDACGSLTTV